MAFDSALTALRPKKQMKRSKTPSHIRSTSYPLPRIKPFELDGPSLPELMFWPDDCNPPGPWPDDCVPKPSKRCSQMLLWPELDP
jgi:hypothetical protein